MKKNRQSSVSHLPGQPEYHSQRVAQTGRLYTRLTVKVIHELQIRENGYTKEELPSFD
ncbi:hypothetical protein [Paenibacillus sp. Leaf72]|uniref:hypothetical protein n=1 Tax=Paenibacillus sp. Leaf72 TaxID=1736234 RepID=UPI000A7BB2C2|nr:hypothetical protein [Paenibacillus sp. Leaf72]